MWRTARFVAVLIVASLAMLVIALRVAPIRAHETASYVILYKQPRVPTDIAATVDKAGGMLLQRYDQLGVAIARSNHDDFREQLLRDQRVEGVAKTENFALPLESSESTPSFIRQTDPVQPIADALAKLALIAQTRPVTIGSIGGGIAAHPSAESRLDPAASVSCASGVPDTSPGAWAGQTGNGMATADKLIEAIDDMDGSSATGIEVAAIRVTDANGDVSPQAMLCAFVWAGAHQMTTVVNGNLATPIMLTCRNDPEQRTLWYAEQRALTYAQQQGVQTLLGGDDRGEGGTATSITPPATATPESNSPPDPDACVVVSLSAPTSP